jgi:hypothetical protein
MISHSLAHQRQFSKIWSSLTSLFSVFPVCESCTVSIHCWLENSIRFTENQQRQSRTESLHISPIQFSFTFGILTSSWYICQKQETAIGTMLVIKLHFMQILPVFSTNALFLFQNLIQDNTWHLTCKLRLLEFETVLYIFLVFEEYLSDISRICLNLCIFDVFFIVIRLRLWSFVRNTIEMKCPCHHIKSRGYAVSMVFHWWH